MSVEAATLEGAFLGMIQESSGNGEAREEDPTRPPSTNPPEATGSGP
jgi:hypothetical protein